MVAAAGFEKVRVHELPAETAARGPALFALAAVRAHAAGASASDEGELGAIAEVAGAAAGAHAAVAVRVPSFVPTTGVKRRRQARPSAPTGATPRRPATAALGSPTRRTR
jgi:hypothetical protein